MGGMQTLADPAAFAQKIHVLWQGLGTAEPEGSVPASASWTRRCQSRIAHVYVYWESPGTDHELADLAPQPQRLRRRRPESLD